MNLNFLPIYIWMLLILENAYQAVAIWKDFKNDEKLMKSFTR